MDTFTLKPEKLAAVLAAALCVGVAQADVLIDNFSTGPYFKSLTAGTDLNVQTGTMVGLSRTTLMTVEANPFGQRYELSIGSGFAVSNSGTNVDGRLSVSYGYQSDGFGGLVTDNLNLDLSNQDRLRIRFLSNDRNLWTTVTLITNGPANTSAVSHLVAGDQYVPFTQDFMLADLVGTTDLSDVDQIEVSFDSLPSGDFAMESITAVPEPAGLLAIGVGMAGVIARRRRRS
jgi:hypothetical protein